MILASSCEALAVAWQTGGRHGLTMPFLCAATGSQPIEFVKWLLKDERVHMLQCSLIRRPVVRLCFTAPSNRLMLRVVTGVLSFLSAETGIDRSSMDTGDFLTAAVPPYLMAQLLSGKVSYHHHLGPYDGVFEDEPFLDGDITFIRRILGKEYPPPILGVADNGGIEYGTSNSRDGQQRECSAKGT